MILAFTRLEIPLLQLHHMGHAWALVDLLEELFQDIIAALGLALDLMMSLVRSFI